MSWVDGIASFETELAGIMMGVAQVALFLLRSTVDRVKNDFIRFQGIAVVAGEMRIAASVAVRIDAWADGFAHLARQSCGSDDPAAWGRRSIIDLAGRSLGGHGVINIWLPEVAERRYGVAARR